MKNNTFVKEFKLTVNHVDANENLSPRAAMQILQDVATEHAADCGLTWRALQDAGKFLVVTKIKAFFCAPIKLNQTVVAETWPIDVSRLYADRDYLLKDVHGNILLRATSQWALLDIAARRIERIELLRQFFDFNYRTDRAVSPDYKRIILDDSFVSVYKHTVRFTDLDRNYHVNNTCYADYALNAIPFEVLSKKEINELEIHFVNELKINDKIDIKTCTKDSSYEIIGLKQDSPAFRANFVFK